MRRLGFKQEVLINVYRSLALSHFTYSAPLLTSASERAKVEMEHFQSRILATIGASEEEASRKYNIMSVKDLIDNTCKKLLKRILADEKHPLTTRIPRVKRDTRQKFKFRPSKAKKKIYANSFVQKYLRTLRDGWSDLYTAKTKTSRTI